MVSYGHMAIGQHTSIMLPLAAHAIQSAYTLSFGCSGGFGSGLVFITQASMRKHFAGRI